MVQCVRSLKKRKEKKAESEVTKVMKLIPKTAFFPRFMAGLVDWLFGWAVWVQSGGCLGAVQQRRSTGGGSEECWEPRVDRRGGRRGSANI